MPEALEDQTHAAKSGLVQALTALGQGLLPLAQVLMARLFGATIFGVYQTTLAVVEMALRGGTGGADKAMLRYVAAARGQGDEPGMLRALGTGLRLCLALSLPLAAVLALGAPWLAALLHTPGLVPSLPRMALAVPCTGLMYVLVQASLGAKVTRASFFVRGLGEPAALLIAALVAAWFGPSVSSLATAHAAASLATLLLAVVVVGKVFGPRSLRTAVGAEAVPGLVTFAWPLGASELVNAVLQRVDILLLSALAGPRAAGLYAAAEFIGRLVANVRYALDSIAAGMFSEAHHRGERERLRHNLALTTRWVVTLAAPLAILTMVFGRALLRLYGSDFVVAATALSVLSVSHFVNASLGLTGWVLMVSGRSRLLLVDNVVCAFLNAGLGLLLIPRYGLTGAALAVLTTVVFFQALLVGQAWRRERVHPFEVHLLRPLGAALVMLGALVLSPAAWQQGLRAAALALAALILYGTTLLVLGLAPEDRALLAKLSFRFRTRAARSR